MKITKDVLRLTFPPCTMVVQTNYPLALLKAILDGDLSILVRGDPFLNHLDNGVTPKQTPMPFPSKTHQCYVFTSHITAENNHE